MDGTAVVAGTWLMLVSGVAWAQVPGPAPTPSDGTASEGVPETPPSATAPPVAESPAPAPAPQPEPEPKPKPEPETPGARVLWRESDTGSRSHDELEREEGGPETESVQGDEPTPHAAGWSLDGPHFVLAVERITSVLAWSNLSKVESLSSDDPGTEVEVSGTDVAFLGAGAGRSISGVPRLAFDAVLSGGFTIGGSFSYMASADAKSTVTGSANDTTSVPDQSILLFAPRVGGLLRPLPNVAVWLRGGITRISIDETLQGVPSGGDVVDQEVSATLWHLSFDPQLVLLAAPRVAITIATIMDIGLPGTVESGGSAIPQIQVTRSAYGMSAGLAAIF